MTQFKIGDKVRVREHVPTEVYTGTLTVIGVHSVSTYAVDCETKDGRTGAFGEHELEHVKPDVRVKVGDRIRILKDRFQCADVTKGDVLTVNAISDGVVRTAPDPDGNTWLFTVEAEGEGFEVIPQPKFSVGQRVRTTRPIECYGLEAGAVGTVVRLAPRSGYPYRVDFGTDKYVWLAESEIESAPTQEFKLKPGDKVKNLKTGRLGKVYPGWGPGHGAPELREDYVRDITEGYKSPRYATVVPAKALEAWEAEHPGSYDLVVEESAPW